MTSYQPATVDGTEIDPAAPRAQGHSDEDAQLVADQAAELRAEILHFTTDLAGRTLTVTASNAPEGDVVFNFGDGTGELTEQITGPGESAQAIHDYAADGSYAVSIRTREDRFAQTVAVNWPAPFPDNPQPFPEEL